MHIFFTLRPYPPMALLKQVLWSLPIYDSGRVLTTTFLTVETTYLLPRLDHVADWSKPLCAFLLPHLTHNHHGQNTFSEPPTPASWAALGVLVQRGLPIITLHHCHGPTFMCPSISLYSELSRAETEHSWLTFILIKGMQPLFHFGYQYRAHTYTNADRAIWISLPQVISYLESHCP